MNMAKGVAKMTIVKKPKLGSRSGATVGGMTAGSKVKTKVFAGSATVGSLTGVKSSGGRFVMRFFDSKGNISVERVAKAFGMSKVQLAETIGLKPETVYRSARLEAPKTQTRTTKSSDGLRIGPVAKSKRWLGTEPSLSRLSGGARLSPL
jgi:hypothetical protein